MSIRDKIVDILRGGQLQYIEEEVMADAILAMPEILNTQAVINEKDERIEELELACEIVSSEFEGDLWSVCRNLLTKTHFDFSLSVADGVYADDFEGHMNETLSEFNRAEAKIAELENALAAASGTIAAMRADRLADLPDMIAPLVWVRNGSHWAGGYGYVVRKLGSQYTLTIRNQFEREFDELEDAQSAANTHYRAAVMAAFTGETE